MVLRMSFMYLSKSLVSSHILGSNFDNQMFNNGGTGWEPLDLAIKSIMNKYYDIGSC